jgi:acetyl esterase/lipase
LTVSEPLLGAVLISPWISFATNTPSFTSNKYKDCLGPVPLQAWSQSFLGSSPSDNYTEALNAPESWWEGLQVQEIFVVAGEDEVLVDVIKEFAVKLKSGLGKGRVKSLVVKNEYHDQPNLDLGMGVKEKDESIQSREIKGWLRSKL